MQKSLFKRYLNRLFILYNHIIEIRSVIILLCRKLNEE
nr:MAG TPA: hypothetical protein [Caudoviricetes sp.]